MITPAEVGAPAPIRILVAGPARSGTTWIAEGLAAGAHATYVHEPDNPRHDPVSWASIRRLGRYPMLPVEDEAHEYERIWKLAFRGGWRFPSREAVRTLVGGSLWRARQGVPALAALNRGLGSGRPRVVVKTVLGVNSVEWIARRHNPAVVLVRRKVLSVVASWKNLGWTVTEIPGVHGRPTLEELLQRFPFLRDCLPMPTAGTAGACAWWTAAHHAIQDSVLDRNPGWLLADHDDLCVDPVDGFHGLLAGLGLPSSSAVEAFVVASNGEAGGPYVTRRLTAEQPQTWRQILTPAEVADVSAVADAFPARHLTSSKLTG